jgi:hypothetical protein
VRRWSCSASSKPRRCASARLTYLRIKITSSIGNSTSRLSDFAIDASRVEAIRLLDPGAADLDEVFARKVFHQRVFEGGPVRAGRELHVLAEKLSRIPCCPTTLQSEGKRTHFLIAGVPRMDGHPLAELETDAVTFDGIVVDVSRIITRATAVITGAMSAHTLGRWGERHDVEPEQAPRFVRMAHHAAIWLAIEPRAEQGIAMRLTEHRRAEADADVYLVGNLRRHPDTEQLMFTDWRSVLYRDWIAPELARFGDLLTGILCGSGPAPLPYVPPRAHYSDETRKNA